MIVNEFHLTLLIGENTSRKESEIGMKIQFKEWFGHLMSSSCPSGCFSGVAFFLTARGHMRSFLHPTEVIKVVHFLLDDIHMPLLLECLVFLPEGC